jgi:hypothetical protein
MRLADTLIERVLGETEMDKLLATPKYELMSGKLRLLYELEYKYHKIKTSAVFGPRPQNVLGHIERISRDLIKWVTKEFLRIFNAWLFGHSHDSDMPDEPDWDSMRREADKLIHALQKAAKEDEGKFTPEELQNAAPPELEVAKKAVKTKIDDVLVGMNGDANFLLRDALYQEFLDDAPDLRNRGYAQNTPWDVFLTLVILRLAMSDRNFFDKLYQAMIKVANRWHDRQMEQYEEYIERYEIYLGVKNARDILQKINMSGELGGLFWQFNHALNVAHNNGTMMEYIQSEWPEIDDDFLERLSNQSTRTWDRELRNERLIQ